MRSGLRDSGWAGSLFDEPIAPVAAPWASKPVDTFAGAAFRQPVSKIESSQGEGLDFSKEWYYCASGNAIRNHLPCDECTKSEPREEIHCIRLFKLHPCAYFNSAHCNGSTCEYWSPFGDNPHCTYGPYLAWLAATSVPSAEDPSEPTKPEGSPVLQDCSDCLCPSCANNGASCTDCKGPEKCAKHNTKMGLCPDFRWKDGKEQDCMHGCLCIGCALVGQECKECVGPIRCSKPTMKCKKYVGGDMEDIGDDTEDPYTPEHPYPGDGKVPDLIDVLEGKA